jgi:hypothetical protein
MSSIIYIPPVSNLALTAVQQTNGVFNNISGTSLYAQNLSSSTLNIASSLTVPNITCSGVSQQLKIYPSVNNAESSIILNTQINGTGNSWTFGQGSYSSGAGNFGIGNTTNNLTLKIDGTTGFIYPQKCISFAVSVTRKLLVLYDGGSVSSQTDHRFNGFGTDAFINVYQANASTDHVFYGATSATTSNELFRIKSTGAISCTGTLASGAHTCTTLNAGYTTHTANIGFNNNSQNKMIALFDSGVATDVTRFDYFGWGVSTNTLRYQTMSWADHVFFGATTSTANLELFRIKGTGAVSCSGTLASGAITTTSITLGTSTTPLNYYSEYDMTTNFTGAFTTSLSIPIKLTRIGRKVTIDIQSDYTQSGVNANVLTSALAIPAVYRPTASSGYSRGVHAGFVNSGYGIGNTFVMSSGFITITGGTDSTNFSTTGTNGFLAHSFTWTI